MFLHLTIADWIKIAIYLGPVVTFGLTYLSRQSFIVKSTAWSAIVAGASRIVAQIEDTLQANPSMDRSQLIAAGIKELRTVYVDSFAQLGWSTTEGDELLTLLFQRLAKGTTPALDKLISQFLGGGASTVSGATATIGVKQPIKWARPVGAVSVVKPGKF